MLSLNKNWNSLIKPSKVASDLLTENGNIAQFTIEPLERGFGITIGNALRRVLLSSLQGAAITSLRIPGVVHEFSSVSGVREDIVDIILNVKSIVVNMQTEEKRVLRVNAVGPCTVTAGMIETGHDVEILNPEQPICTLAKGATLEMEFVSEVGKGYVPAASAREKDLPLGVIPIDALFSPVKKVAYKVENTRIGQVTDYDKLKLTIETNGTITPEISLALAARILQDQLQLFIVFDETEDDKKEKLEELPFDPVLLKKVNELELTVRSYNCLKSANIVYIGDLVIKTEAEMLKMPNFGRKSLNEIKEILSRFSLRFGMDVVGWPPENIEDLAKKYEEPY
ncbi:MAG: rpoA [Rickettsiaceae bacterium]|jgi:DNA-directed RNA polymerase subunit alpha|nr:rpoA [Rickettsiaceae bacterium]